MKLQLYPFQLEAIKSIKQNRYTVLNCSRRVGKSYISAVIAFLHCLNNPYKHVLLISPTTTMAVGTFWSLLNEFAREISPMPTIKVQEKEIVFSNGSLISLNSCDKPDRLRGRSGKAAVSLIILDEFGFVRGKDAEELFVSVLQPYAANAAANCKFLIISTPKGIGNYYYELYQRGKNEKFDEYNTIHFDCYSARPDLKVEFDKLKMNMDPKQFQQEMLAEFLTKGNNVFLNFDELHNIDHEIKDVQEKEPLVIGIDQNVGLMSCVVSRVKETADGHKIEIIREYEGHWKDIPSVIGGLKELFPTNRMTIVPDSSMTARSAAAGIGNDSITQFKAAGFSIKKDTKNPPILDSINVVNETLLSGEGRRRLKIHPNCEKTIHAIQVASWADVHGNRMIKDNKTDHLTDVIRYLCWQFRKKSGFTFVRNFNTF